MTEKEIRQELLNGIRNSINKRLKEPEYQHNGENWKNGLIMAEDNNTFLIAICSFRNEYFFLSNFYEAPVTYKGITYQNNEAAFQAQKTLDENIKKSFANLNPSEAKRKGRSVALRKDWEQVKFDIMKDIVYAKFTQNEELKEKLLDTKDVYLEEGNNWGDRIWGTVNHHGCNFLGEILMSVRKELQMQLSHELSDKESRDK